VGKCMYVGKCMWGNVCMLSCKNVWENCMY